MGLDKASAQTRTRVSRAGAKALHAQDKAHKFNPEKAREAAVKRWANHKAIQDASRDSRQQQEDLETSQ